jgi:hypothetical protein
LDSDPAAKTSEEMKTEDGDEGPEEREGRIADDDEGSVTGKDEVMRDRDMERRVLISRTEEGS